MKALVLAGGFPQISLIKELKKRGYSVILADYNDEPVAKKHTVEIKMLDKDAKLGFTILAFGYSK